MYRQQAEANTLCEGRGIRRSRRSSPLCKITFCTLRTYLLSFSHVHYAFRNI